MEITAKAVVGIGRIAYDPAGLEYFRYSGDEPGLRIFRVNADNHYAMAFSVVSENASNIPWVLEPVNKVRQRLGRQRVYLGN